MILMFMMSRGLSQGTIVVFKPSINNREAYVNGMSNFCRYFAMTEMFMIVPMVINKFDLKLTTEVPQMVSVGLCAALLTSCDSSHLSDASCLTVQ